MKRKMTDDKMTPLEVIDFRTGKDSKDAEWRKAFKELQKALKPVKPVDVTPALEALKSYGQLDPEGIMVSVSRQAVDEVVSFIEQGYLQQLPEKIEGLERFNGIIGETSIVDNPDTIVLSKSELEWQKTKEERDTEKVKRIYKAMIEVSHE